MFQTLEMEALAADGPAVILSKAEHEAITGKLRDAQKELMKNIQPRKLPEPAKVWAYRVEDLAGMCDFNLTWEWFGEFRPENKERGFGEKRPSPFVLVTPKVMNIFRDAGVTTFRWTPVDIEG